MKTNESKKYLFYPRSIELLLGYLLFMAVLNTQFLFVRYIFYNFNYFKFIFNSNLVSFNCHIENKLSVSYFNVVETKVNRHLYTTSTQYRLGY